MVALGDLFDGVDADPAALAPDADPIERGRAVLRSLRPLAAVRPVLVAIDDVQWCDPISAAALRYALRRLDTEPVAVLATERAGSRRRPPAEPVAVVPTDRTEAIDLGPLPLDAIRQAIAPVVGTITRPALRRIHELSGGNPLYATELARTPGATGDRLARWPPAAWATPWPPASPTSTRASARSCGCRPPSARPRPSAWPRWPAARRAPSPPRWAPTCWRWATTCWCGSPTRCWPRWSWPAPTRSTARPCTAAWPTWSTDPDDRARHLALSAATPDAEVAAELEAAAQRAGRRGAPGAAAEFAAHALRLTPPGDPAPRRALAEVAARAGAGETGRALALNDALVERLGRRPDRVARRHPAGVPRLRRQRPPPRPGAGRRRRRRRPPGAGARAAGVRRRPLPRPAGRRDGPGRGRAGVAVAEGDAVLEVLASGTLATASLVAGHPRPDLMDRAMELAEQHERPPLGRWPQVLRAATACGAAGSTRPAGDSRPWPPPSRAPGWSSSGPTGWPTGPPRGGVGQPGRRPGAGRGRPGGRRRRRQRPGRGVGRLPDRPGARPPGRRGGGPGRGRRAAGLGRGHDNPPRLLTGHHVRGVVALAAGDGEAAAAALAPAIELARRSGHRHPGYVPFLPDAVEAAALAGDAASCAELAAELGPGRRPRRAVGRRRRPPRPGPRRTGGGRRPRRRPAGRGRRRLRRARLPARCRPHPPAARPGAAPGRPAPGGRGGARRRPRPVRGHGGRAVGGAGRGRGGPGRPRAGRRR